MYKLIAAGTALVFLSSVTYDCSSGTACLQGNASGSATDGVYGSASGSGTHGVYGTSNNAGVTGYTSSQNGGSGVSGVSTNSSGSAHGVYGNSSNGPGVYGTSDAQDGVIGVTAVSSGTGLYGLSKGNGNGVSGEAGSDGLAVAGAGDNSSTNLLYAHNEATLQYCTINAEAALHCTGGVSGPSVRVQHRNAGGRRLLAYALESASATIEDVGTARLSGGVANVRIDPGFASVIDQRWYYVFLTPLGDTRGLYVSTKTPAAFQVREAKRGRSSAAFNYRIVAHPLDAKNDRLPPAHPAQ